MNAKRGKDENTRHTEREKKIINTFIYESTVSNCLPDTHNSYSHKIETQIHTLNRAPKFNTKQFTIYLNTKYNINV